jgi:hypothetical protein
MTTTATPTPEAQIVADARALGVSALTDAKGSIVSLLTAVENSSVVALPTLETDAGRLAISFLPPMYQTVIQGFAGSALAALEPESVGLLKTGWGIALTRIEALL